MPRPVTDRSRMIVNTCRSETWNGGGPEDDPQVRRRGSVCGQRPSFAMSGGSWSSGSRPGVGRFSRLITKVKMPK